MIDIHTHILPGVDDGAQTPEEARTMLEMAARDGTRVIVATPHADTRYRFDSDACRTSADTLRAVAPLGLRICSGCEVHLTPENMEAVLRAPEAFTLDGGDCILLELPPQVLPQIVMPALEALVAANLRAIVAHPERNPYLQRHAGFALELVNAGCYLQLTAGSLTGSFGPTAQSSAGSLLKSRLAHFVASDGHGAERRRPLLSAAYDAVVALFDQPTADLLFKGNPDAALNGAAIRSMPARAAWFSGFFGRSSNATRKEQIPATVSWLRR